MNDDPYQEGSLPDSSTRGSKIQRIDLTDVDVIEGDELEQLEAELFREAHLIAEDDYYAILNIDKDATEEDVKIAYKRLCLVFHPDKHPLPKDKARAEAKFQLIQKANDVLTDPQARYIYDKYGAQMAAMSWKIGQPLKTPQEVMEEFEKKMRAAQDPINSKGEMYISIDARKYFKQRIDLGSDGLQFLSRAKKSRGLKEILTFPEVTQVRIGHSWETRLGQSTTLSLQGIAVSRTVVGESSVSATISHMIRPGWTTIISCGIGDQSTLSGTLIHYLNRKTIVAVTATAENLESPPQLSLTTTRFFDSHNSGSITLSPSSSFLGSWGNALGGLYDGSCSLSWNTVRANDQISVTVQASTAESRATVNYICSFSKDYRAKVSFGLSNRAGILTLFYASRRATKHLRIGCGVEYGAVSGVTFILSLARKGHRLKFPVLFDDSFNSSLISCALALPFFSSLFLDHYYFKPKKRQEFIAKVRFLRENHKEILAKRKHDAEEAVEVMKTVLQNKITVEVEKDGLIVLEALYGKLPDATLLHVEPLSSKGLKKMTSRLSRKISNSFSNFKGIAETSEFSETDEFIDVTAVIQNLVNNSQLFISGGYSKSSLLGFYDPCLGEAKRLRVTYQFQGVVHQVEVDDTAPLAAPIRSHVVKL